MHVNSVSCVKLLVQNEHATHIPSADDQGFIPLSLAALSGLNDIVKVSDHWMSLNVTICCLGTACEPSHS